MTDQSPDRIAAVAETVRASAREFGFRDDHPEGRLVAAWTELLTEHARRLEAATALPGDRAEAALRRAAPKVLQEAASAARGARAWLVVGGVVGGLGLAVAAGVGLGWAVRGAATYGALADLQAGLSRGIGGEEWLVGVARLNDPDEMRRECRATRYGKPGEGSACTVRVWSPD